MWIYFEKDQGKDCVLQTFSSAEPLTKKEGKERKKGGYATSFVKVGSRQDTSCLFSDNNHWLIPLISGERECVSCRKIKSRFAIFFCILLKVDDVLCDKRMIKTQKTTSEMTHVLYSKNPPIRTYNFPC